MLKLITFSLPYLIPSYIISQTMKHRTNTIKSSTNLLQEISTPNPPDTEDEQELCGEDSRSEILYKLFSSKGSVCSVFPTYCIPTGENNFSRCREIQLSFAIFSFAKMPVVRFVLLRFLSLTIEFSKERYNPPSSPNYRCHIYSNSSLRVLKQHLEY